MALLVLSDTHLATANAEKSMEAFGHRWQDYIHRIEKNWLATVSAEDTVVIPGDITWAMTLEESRADLAFLDRLPGKKLLGKGNHDFWWTTASKMYRFFEENGFSSLGILYNNAYRIEGCVVCGTRGWFIDPSLQKTVGTVDYTKIVNREVIRLKMSLDAARALCQSPEDEIIPFLHFPPAFGDFRCKEIQQLLTDYGVKRCYYGHIHGNYAVPSRQVLDGVEYHLVSADYLNFTPIRVL